MREVLQEFLDESIAAFRSYKKLAEAAAEQVSDEEFFRLIDAESNSIALIYKHLGGNLRSRWTDFLTTDGEKPDRNRDAEFAETGDTRASLIENWEVGWRTAFGALESLRVEDLNRKITIRGEEFTVLRAVLRSLSHAAYHTGQIAFLAKHLLGADWKTLSIPKNKSVEFSRWLGEHKSKGHYLDTVKKFADEK